MNGLNHSSGPLEESGDNWRFLPSTTWNDVQLAFFSENLATFSSESEEKVGKLTCAATNTRRLTDTEDCVFVRCASDGVIDNASCGRTLMAFISHTGVLLEQRQQEYFSTEMKDRPTKRDTVIKRLSDCYELVKTEDIGEERPQVVRQYSFDEMKDVVTEGASLLLQRLIARNGLRDGRLDVLTIDSDLALCPVRYTLLEPVIEVVDSHERELIVLERCVNPDTDKPETWKLYLTSDGHMVRRTQLGSTLQSRLVDFSSLPEADDPYRKPVFDMKPLDWEEDLEMQSKFLDRKEELKAKHATYMRKHPELQAIVGDFLQFVLLRRPDDVFATASEYFATFSAQRRPQSKYARSNKIQLGS